MLLMSAVAKKVTASGVLCALQGSRLDGLYASIDVGTKVAAIIELGKVIYQSV